MDDLVRLNRSIAEFWLGRLAPNQEAYLGHAPVCVGDLACDAVELTQVLAASKQARVNRLNILELNRQYLQFARLAAKDVAAGKLDRLIQLGLNLDQARVLSQLTNEDIALLALAWQEPIVRFASPAFTKGAVMHARAASQHARALLATRPALNDTAGS